VIKVWRVTLNTPQMSVNHSYNRFDIVAPTIQRAIQKAQKHCKADGLGRPYVSEVVEISKAE
jgi:hypothetical protein